jgi:hypothetical protein
MGQLSRSSQSSDNNTSQIQSGSGHSSHMLRGGSSSLHRSSTLHLQSRLSQLPDPSSILDNNGNVVSTDRVPLWKQIVTCGYSSQNIYRLHRCIRSRVWKALSIFFSVFLLFGSQIQHLCVPPGIDIVFDILDMITFCFFLVDMGFRTLAEPNYFHFHLCGTTRGSGAFGAFETTPTTTTTKDSSACEFGSFVFWCDLVSTGVLLYDVSCINANHYDVVKVAIDLDTVST